MENELRKAIEEWVEYRIEQNKELEKKYPPNPPNDVCKHPDANIIWGSAFDERLQDEMSITVVATGFESTPGVDEPIQAVVNAQRAAAAAAPAVAPAAPRPAAAPAPAPAPAPAADPVIPNPVFSNVFNPNVDTPVSTAPAAKEDDSNEDDGDYFNDLLSILNKRS